MDVYINIIFFGKRKNHICSRNAFLEPWCDPSFETCWVFKTCSVRCFPTPVILSKSDPMNCRRTWQNRSCIRKFLLGFPNCDISDFWLPAKIKFAAWEIKEGITITYEKCSHIFPKLNWHQPGIRGRFSRFTLSGKKIVLLMLRRPCHAGAEWLGYVGEWWISTKSNKLALSDG